MPAMDQLLDQHTEDQINASRAINLYEGTICAGWVYDDTSAHPDVPISVSAPGDISAPVYVKVVAAGEKHFYGPCPWMTRPQASVMDPYRTLLPRVGDRALLAVTDEGKGWVVAWWPYERKANPTYTP